MAKLVDRMVPKIATAPIVMGNSINVKAREQAGTRILGGGTGIERRR